MIWTADKLRGRAKDMLKLAVERQAVASDRRMPSGIRYAAAVQAEEARDLAVTFELLAARRKEST